MLYYQRQCLNYTAPSDRVIFDAHQETAETLLKDKRSGGFIPIPSGFPDAAREAPACLVEMDRRMSATCRMCPGEPAFMHERISKGGLRRLVIVSPETLYNIAMDAVIDPATFFNPPSVALIQNSIVKPGDLTFLTALPGIRIYAGQPDSRDSSHFTIAYEVYEKKGIVDGYLQDDGTISLVNRFGPATRRSVLELPGPPDFKHVPAKALFRRPGGDLIDERPSQRSTPTDD